MAKSNFEKILVVACAVLVVLAFFAGNVSGAAARDSEGSASGGGGGSGGEGSASGGGSSGGSEGWSCGGGSNFKVSCEWSWPQKIVYSDKSACSYARPYCNYAKAQQGVAQCCKHNGKTYYDCVNV